MAPAQGRRAQIDISCWALPLGQSIHRERGMHMEYIYIYIYIVLCIIYTYMYVCIRTYIDMYRGVPHLWGRGIPSRV